MNNKFLGNAEIAKLAEKIMKVGRGSEVKSVDADEVGLNLSQDWLHGVSVEWSLSDSPKFLMIKADAPKGNLVGRIYVRKATAEEKAEFGW